MSNLVDRGKQVLICSACDAPLVEIWTTRKTAPTPWKIKANCPHCGDHSYIMEVDGDFHWALVQPFYTNVLDVQMEPNFIPPTRVSGGNATFLTGKGNVKYG